MTEEKLEFREEIRLIPWWAIALSVVIFVVAQVFFHTLILRHPNPPPPPLRGILGLLAGAVFVFLTLLVGYVNRDAKRRSMKVGLWTALVIFIPNAIGFILYFLLRQPLRIKCPECGALVDPSFNYCSNCRCNLRPTCPQCRRAVTPGDKFCGYCAQELGAVAR